MSHLSLRGEWTSEYCSSLIMQQNMWFTQSQNITCKEKIT